MSIAATVRALVNAGCTPEQIAAAVDAWEASEREAASRSDDERRANARERQRRSRASRNVTNVTPVTVTSVTEPPSRAEIDIPAPTREVIRNLPSEDSYLLSSKLASNAREATEIEPDDGGRAGSEAYLALRKRIADVFVEAGRMPPDTTRVGVWLSHGWPSDVCVSVVRTVLARNPKMRGLAYCDEAIRDAVACGASSPSQRAPPPPRPVKVTVFGEMLAKARQEAARG